MNKPVIAIVPLYDEERDSLWMHPGYMEGVIEAGGIPVMLSLVNDDVSLKENWVLLNNEDMASKTEEYYINFFKEHHLEEAIDEIKAVTEKNKSFFQRFVNHEEVDAKEMRDFMEPYRFIKSKYILNKSSKS